MPLSKQKIEAAAKAICLAQFGDETIHGEARCCQVGGLDGCCVESLLPVAEAALKAAEQAEDEEDGEKHECVHEWAYTGTAYGGDDPSYFGEGRCYCVHCGADGDA